MWRVSRVQNDGVEVSGRPGFKLASKLSFLKSKLKEWSKENKGNWKGRKDHILEQIGNMELMQEVKLLIDDEQLMKVQLAMEYEEVTWNEVFWRQSPRMQ